MKQKLRDARIKRREEEERLMKEQGEQFFQDEYSNKLQDLDVDKTREH